MDVKRKITISIGLFSSILIIFIIYFVYSDASYLLQENQKEIMNIQLERVSENISYLMEVNEKETEKLSIDTQVDNYFYGKTTSKKLNEYLVELMISKNDENYYKDFFILNKDGNMVSTTMQSAEHLDLSTRSYFKIAKKTRKTVSSNILIAKSDGELIVITLTPIIEKDNIIGYAGIAIKAEYFSKFINNIKLGHNGYYIIVDSNGLIISHPNKELITKNIQNLNINDERNISLYKEMDDLNYKLIAVANKKEINVKLDKLLLNVYIIGGLGIILSILLSFFLANIIMKPIERINKHFEKVINTSALFNKNLKNNKNYFLNHSKNDNNIGKLEKNTSFVLSKINSSEIEIYADEIAKIYENTLKFISKLSHDLRTPLTLIKGYTDVISIQNGNTNREYLLKINNSVKDIENIIYNELDIAYELREETKLNLEEIDLSEFSKILISELNNLAKKFNRNIVIEKEEIDNCALMNETNIKRVIENIFINAIKYSEDKIIVKFVNEEDHLIIKIIDFGIGISNENLLKIKDIFFQKKHNSSGYGLGLYIADRIIEKHDYKLKFESKLEEGTTVSIFINKI